MDSAPGTLDTLNELAAALGDDPNFATTVTNSIATKMPIAGGTFTGNVDFSAGIDVTGNITVTGTVDGRDVATDGSKLDGIEAGATADQTITLSGDITGSGTTSINAQIAANTVGISELNVADGSSGQVLTTDGSGNLSFADEPTVGAYNFNITTTTTNFDTAANTYEKVQVYVNGAFLDDDDFTFTASTGVVSLLEAVTSGQVVSIWAYSSVSVALAYTAGTGLDLAGTTFSIETDLRDGITHVGLDTDDYISFTNNTQIDFYINGSNQFRMEANGDFHADGDLIAYSTTTSSDIRLKEDINVVGNALEKLHKLDGVEFKWKRDGKASAGVIAQQVQEVLPQAVKQVKDLNGEEHLSVNYSALTSVLIEAIKELTAKVDRLEVALHNKGEN